MLEWGSLPTHFQEVIEMALTDAEIEKIAIRLREHPQKSLEDHTDFYIAPEDHYNAHKNLLEMYNDWKGIKDAFMKMMLGFILVGTAVMAVVGIVVEFAKDIPSKLLGH
jgi:hypothetical protein